MAKRKQEILVVDACSLIPLGFESLLSKDYSIRAGTPEDLANAAFALISADYGDPAFRAARARRKVSHDAKMVFYSSHPSKVLIARILEAEADGFFNLHEPGPAIVAGIKKVERGEELFYSEEIERQLVKSRADFSKRTRLQSLSPREREVLTYFAQDYSIKETAELLGLSPTTVETHRQALRAKLNIHGFAGMATYAVRNGLVGTGTI
ncbi:MAG: response regulator transcription factor [Planctomycetales bacterium]